MKWVDVVGYEHLYEISDCSVVRNKSTLYELTKFKRGGKGSDYVGLTKDGRTISTRVKTIYHRAFDNPEKTFKNEKWADIDNYEGIYKVSNMGRVKSMDRHIKQRLADGTIGARFIQGKVLSLNRTNGNGYRIASITNGYKDANKTGNDYVHILVAKAFIPNPENKPTVNHIDGDKLNNKVENLEWATQSEQAIHAFENNLNNVVKSTKGKQLKGSRCYNAKIDEGQAMEIYMISNLTNETHKDIGELYGVSRGVIGSIKNKKSWAHIHQI